MVVTHKDVAKLLADNKIIAIFQGASESGPRALGNRSILHNPSNPNEISTIDTAPILAEKDTPDIPNDMSLGSKTPTLAVADNDEG